MHLWEISLNKNFNCIINSIDILNNNKNKIETNNKTAIMSFLVKYIYLTCRKCRDSSPFVEISEKTELSVQHDLIACQVYLCITF